MALTRRCAENCRHDFLEAGPDFGRRAFLYHDGAGHACADQPISTRYTIVGGEWAEAKEIMVMGPSRDDAALAPPRELFNG
jgi:hypothetical protein